MSILRSVAVSLSACLFLIATACSGPGAGPEARQAKSQDRMAWWREARFGLFIHWGLYAIPAGTWKGKRIPGVGEWIQNRGNIPPEEYATLTEQWNPTGFDAAEWASIMKDAGVRYFVITSKHHDGFCLFDSKETDFDVMSTPFHRDIMKELSEACRKEKIRVGWYHSIMDWHHPDYLPRHRWDKRPAKSANFDRYVQHLHAQVTELIQNYAPVDLLWFDGEWEKTWTHKHGVALYDLCRKLNPDIIVNNRVDKGRRGMQGMTKKQQKDPFRGDYGTPEQEIPSTGLPGVDWETCMTMNNTWGFKSYDLNWKSKRDLIRKLIDIASKGGNFLLNVGPTAEGKIPAASVERLRAMGAWLKRYGESIYGTEASPFKKLPFGRATWKPKAQGGTLYLSVFDWPQNSRLLVPGLRNLPISARVLGGGALRTVTDRDGAWIEGLPVAAPNADASVIALDFAKRPQIEIIHPRLGQELLLDAESAGIHGPSLKVETIDGRKNLGYWSKISAYAEWDFACSKAGRFELHLDFACDEASKGSRVAIEVAGKTLEFEVPSTGSWRKFETRSVGRVQIPSVREGAIRVRALRMSGEAVINIRSLRLRRIRG